MPDSDSLAGHHALVTGAGSGIGAAIAQILSEQGARVTLAGRRRAPLEATAADCPSETFIADAFDVTSEAAIARGMTAGRAKFGPVSILVNNAGEAPTAPFTRTDAALVDHVLALDLASVFAVTRAALDDITAQGARGRIINVASTAGMKGYAYASAYCAAKHGVIGMTRALAIEIVKTGVTVNAVCPGFTETPLITQALAEIVAKTGRSEADARARLASANPQARFIAPREVAETVAWLCSPGAQSMTGQAIAIAGGEVMG